MFEENKHIQIKKCNITKTFYSFHNFSFRFLFIKVVQRRLGITLRFDRDWDAYQVGFGDPNDSYWLGKKKVYIHVSVILNDKCITTNITCSD